MQALLPDYVLKYKATNPELEDALKEIMNSSLSTKMTLMQQIRILMQHLDPKVRLQPMTSGIGEETGVFRYAISQQLFAIKGIRKQMAPHSMEVTSTLFCYPKPLSPLLREALNMT